ncbi:MULTISPECIES: CAP domain-containing protein [unclassified Leptolyngbya]|uniref:CAP domain-containing protein n=1 Tax=unclassified Leptolyngbya TaxID=2650499 RepID=UPI0016879112|nr:MULTISPECIES: CAP domain-containing protein [unclassified Leptolyngbya]MBD1911959.1 CAP domain-containing protein [Leptolyngbya sp. FACHB-8]MBD2157105.1 CAP domain-containing protein [Leptolyngbya sp. FACHB-16]
MIPRWILHGFAAIALLLGDKLPQACNQLPIPPIGSNPSATTPASPELPSNALEQKVFEQINAYRQSKGMPPLAYSSVIAQQSKQHSVEMSQQGAINHNGFEQRVEAIAQSIRYRSAGENVASNRGYADPAAQAVIGWLNSPGHLHNIEGNFNLTGVGVVQAPDGTYYLTQIFIRRP